MALISKTLRNGVDNRLLWHCPGCKTPHMIQYGEGTGPRWTWNGNAELPTFSPSVLVTWNEPSDVPEEFDNRLKDVGKRCHSFVVDGKMQFLTDSTHSLAGQTVDIPNWPSPENWKD